MKVAIVGSRHFSEPDRVSDYVGSLPHGASIITGSGIGNHVESLVVLLAWCGGGIFLALRYFRWE